MSEYAARMPGALLGASMLTVLGNADVTGRYGTERKNHQDPDENSCFPIRSTPVDNREIDPLRTTSDRWMLADEQFELFIASIQSHAGRHTRLLRERWETPKALAAAQAFEEHTEQLRQVIRIERGRWLAETRRTA